MDKHQYQIILQITLFPWVWVIRWKNEAIRKLGKSLGAHSAYIFRYHQSLWDRCPMDHLNWCHSQMSLRQTIILCPARPPTTPERRPAAISCGDKDFSNQLLSLSLPADGYADRAVLLVHVSKQTSVLHSFTFTCFLFVTVAPICVGQILYLNVFIIE